MYIAGLRAHRVVPKKYFKHKVNPNGDCHKYQQAKRRIQRLCYCYAVSSSWMCGRDCHYGIMSSNGLLHASARHRQSLDEVNVGSMLCICLNTHAAYKLCNTRAAPLAGYVMTSALHSRSAPCSATRPRRRRKHKVSLLHTNLRAYSHADLV